MKKIVSNTFVLPLSFICFLFFTNVLFINEIFGGYTGVFNVLSDCSPPSLQSSPHNNSSPSFSSTQSIEREYQPSSYKNAAGETITPDPYFITSYPDCDIHATEDSVDKRYAGNGISTWTVYSTSNWDSSSGSSEVTINIYWDYQVDVYIKYDGSDYGAGDTLGKTDTNSLLESVKANRASVAESYVDVGMPQFICTVFRADGSTDNCSGSVIESEDKKVNDKHRLMCAYYASTHTQDANSVCFERYYVTEVNFAEGLDGLHVYPGFEHPMSCIATFGDGEDKILDHTNNKFISHVFYTPKTPINTNFIGNAGQLYPYYYHYSSLEDADKFYIKPLYKNYFLSHHSGTSSHEITCAYYATVDFANNQYDLIVPVNDRVQNSNVLFKDSDSGGSEPYNTVKTDKITVHNQGITEMKLTASGSFAEYDKDNSKISLIDEKFELKAHKDYFTEDYFFTAGHFYDFIMVIKFDDGKTADVTNHPFSSFNTDLWYDGTPNHNPTPNVAGCMTEHDCLSALPNVLPADGDYYSGFPRVGSKHRIPFNIKNPKPVIFVSGMYLHNYDFLKEYATNKGPGRTHLRGLLKVREAIDFSIQEADASGNLTKLEKDKILIIDKEADEKRNFAAIVTYNNGDVENWSNTVNWNRDFQKGTNPKYRPFDFTSIKDNHRHVTIFADIVNKKNLTFNYYRKPLNPPQGLSNEVQTVFAPLLSFDKKEGPNFEWYHDEQLIRLIDCRLDAKAFNNLAFGCEPVPAPYKVDIVASTPPDYNNADLPQEIKDKLKEQIQYKFEFSTDNSYIKLPETLMAEPKVQSQDETHIFYDYREFPVSGMSGSVGDN